MICERPDVNHNVDVQEQMQMVGCHKVGGAARQTDIDKDLKAVSLEEEHSDEISTKCSS